MNFCPRCGARVKRVPGSAARFCAKCGAGLTQEEAPRKRTLLDSFPFKTLRPSQKNVLEQVEVAVSQPNRFVILEAPVGFGKSAVAAALSRHLGSAYLLTSKKQLQDQYSADFRFPVVTGKSNFTCLVPTSDGKNPPCSKGRCEADWKLSECPHYLTFEEYDEHKVGACKKDAKCNHLEGNKLCPYYGQKWDAFRAPVMVANYPFLLTEISFTEDVRTRRLLVCEEAHPLEKQMGGAGAFSLRRSALEAYRVEGDDGPVAIPDMGLEDAAAWEGPLKQAEERLERFVNTYLADGGMQDLVASCKRALGSLKAVTEELETDPANWVVKSVRTSEAGV